MNGQRDGEFFALSYGLACRFISGDGNQSDLTGRSRWRSTVICLQGREVDLSDYIQDRLSLKGGTVESLLNLGQEPGIQRFRFQPSKLLSSRVLYAHEHTSSPSPMDGDYDRCAIWQDSRSGLVLDYEEFKSHSTG